MTKVELVNEICKLNPYWQDKKGRLHYMLKEELERILQKIKRRLNK